MSATADALLDQFQLPHPEPNIYRLGQYAPVSIRDQVVRSSHLLDRLWVTGLLAVADLNGWKKSALRLGVLDGIVIRHGIDPTTLMVQSAKLRMQHVPAHLP